MAAELHAHSRSPFLWQGPSPPGRALKFECARFQNCKRQYTGQQSSGRAELLNSGGSSNRNKYSVDIHYAFNCHI